MSTSSSVADKQVRNAVNYKLISSTTSITDAMRSAGGFTEAEIKNRTIHMRVRRIHDDMIVQHSFIPTP